MHFGYLNRYYVEELHVPVGPANQVEPLGPDGGQPTYFYTRTHRYAFSVTVPKDWDKKELVWTLTVNAKTQKAIAWLQPEWEIDPAGGAATGGRTDAEYKRNKAPSITVDTPGTATVNTAMTIVANVTDDGLPKPAAPRKAAIGQETPPLLQGGADAPVNVPQVAGRGRDRSATPPGGVPPALTVIWTLWRGPAGATFDPTNVVVKDGKAPTSITFSRAGEYVLRATASDRLLTTQRDVKVTVRGGASQ
jgi:hypothetical protein